MEGGTNIAYTRGRDDVYWLNRFRFDVNVKPSPLFRVLVQAQDARVAAKRTSARRRRRSGTRSICARRMATSATRRRECSRCGSAARRCSSASSAWSGTSRGSTPRGASTACAPRSRAKRLRVDAFATSVVRILDGEFDKSGNGNRFLGAYGSATNWIPKATVEPYVFWRRDQALKAERGDVGNLSAATHRRALGRASSRRASTTASKWPSRRARSRRTRSARGRATGSSARRSVAPGTCASPRNTTSPAVTANPTDGRRQTFDQLYPTGHDKLGLADQVGWKNIRDLRSIVELTPHKGWPVTASLHSWWLADTHDALYNAAGTAVARVPSGAVGSRVGDEIDVQVAHAHHAAGAARRRHRARVSCRSFSTP